VELNVFWSKMLKDDWRIFFRRTDRKRCHGLRL